MSLVIFTFKFIAAVVYFVLYLAIITLAWYKGASKGEDFLTRGLKSMVTTGNCLKFCFGIEQSTKGD